MATLNLTTREFPDIMLIWMFDQMVNQDQITNENFKEFLRENKDLKSDLLRYYLNTDSEMRLRYKRIKKIFDGSDKSIQQIRIGPSEKLEKNKKKDGIIKKVLKKLLTKEEITIEEIEELENIL